MLAVTLKLVNEVFKKKLKKSPKNIKKEKTIYQKWQSKEGKRKVCLFSIPLNHILPTVGYEVPDGPKEEPRDGVGHDEDKERTAPVEIHQRGEDVGQVAVRLLHVAMLHVTAPVLLHVALPLAPRPGWRRDEAHGRERRSKSEENKSLVTWMLLSGLIHTGSTVHTVHTFKTFGKTWQTRQKLALLFSIKRLFSCLKSEWSQRMWVTWRRVMTVEEEQRKVPGDKTTKGDVLQLAGEHSCSWRNRRNENRQVGKIKHLQWKHCSAGLRSQ